MKKYVLIRAFYSLITLWLLVTVVFAMVRLTGDPVAMKAEAGADAGAIIRDHDIGALQRPVEDLLRDERVDVLAMIPGLHSRLRVP